MSEIQTTKCDLAVIGSGLAGIAAAVFASQNGIDTCQIGVSGGILYASGYLDLMGVHPVEDRKIWVNPWEAIDALVRDVPNHPYAYLSKADISQSLDQFADFMADTGLPYKKNENQNVAVVTPVGTVKSTYAVPVSMWNGVPALADGRPCLIVDFWGLKGFSALQITEMLKPRWPDLRAVRIAFPSVDLSIDLYPERMARSMEVDDNIVMLADEVRPNLNGAQVVGFPAILGMNTTERIIRRLKDLLDCDVFEIPTIPPSIPGLRIKENVETVLSARGVRIFGQKRVICAKQNKEGGFLLDIGDFTDGKPEHRLEADGVILASGRFLGMGLHAGRKKIRETLFDLPVFQPADRSSWHRKNFFDPCGHGINRSGLEIDDSFRPLNQSKKPAFDNVFAAGSILAHQDWIRQKCGAGLSISTAYAAVRSFMRHMQR
jgi:glycerol-3-phosphate dehydrogenase subunit B